MIFRQIDEVKSGRKTQTRRVCKPGEWPLFDPVTGKIMAVMRADGVIKYMVGRSYPVTPKMFQASVGRHRITEIRCEHVQAINETDARAEGVATVADYVGLWKSINRRKSTRWEDNPTVWCYTFEFIKEDPAS